MSNEPKWGVRKYPWSKGRWHDISRRPRKRIAYTVRVLHDVTTMLVIIERLGVIWERDDVRWEWRRFKSRYSGWTTGRGLSPNKEQAMAKVLEGWD